MKVSIIVLNWNCQDYLSQCLSSLAKINTTGLDMQTVFVDNDSEDDSVNLVSKEFPEVRIIQNPSNYGYSEGNNVGLLFALSQNADFIWILNPDLTVDPNSLFHLVNAAGTHPQAGIFGPKIYFADKPRRHIIWSAGGRIDWANMLGSNRGVDQKDTGQFDTTARVDFIPGASMFIRSQALKQVGLFDPDYFLYYEENDLCQRTLAAGWKLLYVPGSLAWHANAVVTGMGSPLQDYFITRNRLLFGMKYAPIRTKVALIRESLRLLKSGRRWQKTGVKDFYLHRFGTGSYGPNLHA